MWDLLGDSYVPAMPLQMAATLLQARGMSLPTSRRKRRRRLQQGTATFAFPRSATTSSSNCCRCFWLSTSGRPPARESSPRQEGSTLCFASTASTARRLGRLPSFLRTCLAISVRLAPAARSAQIVPRPKASKRAVLAMVVAKRRPRFEQHV